MYVRLAFAVAAHLEPEILIVDEVLAVGDAEFQKKCLGKMSEVAGGGRTVLFVSHNLAAVRALCKRVLLLNKGALVGDDTALAGITLYQRNCGPMISGTGEWSWPTSEMPGDDTFRLRNICVVTKERGSSTEVFTDEDFEINILYEQYQRLRGVRVSLQLITADGEIAFTTTDHSARMGDADETGTRMSTCCVSRYLLNSRDYVIRIGVDLPGVRIIIDWREIGLLSVRGHHNGGTSFSDSQWPGALSPLLSWTVRSPINPKTVAEEWLLVP